MRYTADDPDTAAWVKVRLAWLKRYLACWRLFTELDQWTQRRHTRHEEGL